MIPGWESAEIKAVVWDLDGTIVSSQRVFHGVTLGLVEEFGLPAPSLDDVHHNFHGTLEDCFRGLFGDSSDGIAPRLIERFLAEQQSHYEEPEQHFFEDVLGLAQRIGELGLRQSIITSRQHRDQGPASPRKIVENSFLRDFIEVVVCPDDPDCIGKKPDASVAQPVLSRFGVQPENVLVIGDQYVDAQLAKNLGGRAVLVDRNGGIPHIERLDISVSHLRIVGSLIEINPVSMATS